MRIDAGRRFFFAVSSAREKVKGLKKAEQAKLVGQTIAERAKSKGIQTVVFDRGGYRYIGRVKAFADGAREGGLQF